jgi:hypothetical protein
MKQFQNEEEEQDADCGARDKGVIHKLKGESRREGISKPIGEESSESLKSVRLTRNPEVRTDKTGESKSKLDEEKAWRSAVHASKSSGEYACKLSSH